MSGAEYHTGSSRVEWELSLSQGTESPISGVGHQPWVNLQVVELGGDTPEGQTGQIVPGPGDLFE